MHSCLFWWWCDLQQTVCRSFSSFTTSRRNTSWFVHLLFLFINCSSTLTCEAFNCTHHCRHRSRFLALDKRFRREDLCARRDHNYFEKPVGTCKNNRMTMTADLYADINNRRVYLYLTTLTFYIIILPKEIKFTETKKILLKNGFWKEKKIVARFLLLSVAFTHPKHVFQVSISSVVLLYASEGVLITQFTHQLWVKSPIFRNEKAKKVRIAL